MLLTSNDAAAIASCLQALGRQHATGFEVIVVDSGSTDGTVARGRGRVPICAASPEPVSRDLHARGARTCIDPTGGVRRT